MSGSTRVVHVITGLELGGAEVILTRLLARLDPATHPGCVISLTSRGPLAEAAEAAGFEVVALDLRSVPGPIGTAKLLAAIRRGRPDVVQTWLLHANVLAGTLARTTGLAPVCWSMHMTAAVAETHGRANVALQSLEARLSRRVPARIVSCSHSTFALMRDSGYEMSRAAVVPNGFETDEAAPEPLAGPSVREELGIGPDSPIVVHAARFHPMKDHRNLLAAAELVHRRHPEATFLLCGTGVEPANRELATWAQPLGVRALLLGPRDDVGRLFAAADVAVLSSATGEAMPLVIGEAMAAGTPVVATDCGDAVELVADTGVVVAVRDPEALARGLMEMLELSPQARAAQGERARLRIARDYSLSGMVDGYEATWREIVTERARG